MIWYFGHKRPYDKIAEHMTSGYLEEDGETGIKRYFLEVGEYTVSLKMPTYLSEGGYICISRTRGYTGVLGEPGEILEGDDLLVSIYIWPKYFKGYTVGIEFMDDYNSIWEQVEVDSNLEIIDSEEYENLELILKLMEENADEINLLVSIAEENLGIDIVD